MEGDIKGCFDNIDHHILVNILKRRIKDEGFHRPDLEAAPGRVSGGLDEAPDLQWHAAGLQGKSTLGEYLYERAGPVHGKAPGAIRQGDKRRFSNDYVNANHHYARTRERNAKKWNTMSEEERKDAKVMQKKLQAILLSTPSRGANGPQLSQSSICPLRR